MTETELNTLVGERIECISTGGVFTVRNILISRGEVMILVSNGAILPVDAFLLLWRVAPRVPAA